MSKQLTPQQIEHLHSFCEKHYVPYYDLQVELVDHLATGIENSWSQDKTLSFDAALNAQFKQFGVYGFSKIKELKGKALKRKHQKTLWKHIFTFFTIPKVVLTLTLTCILFLVFEFSTNLQILVRSLFVIYTLIFVICIVVLFKRRKVDFKKGKKFLYFDQYNRVSSTCVMLLVFPFYTLNFGRLITNTSSSFFHNTIFYFFAALLIVSYGIFLYSVIFYLPKRVKEDFEREYPQFANS